MLVVDQSEYVRAFPAVPSYRVWLARAVTVLACGAVFFAPLGGYLRGIHPEAAKLPAILLVGAWLAQLVVERRWPRLHWAHALLALLMSVMLISTTIHLTSPYALDYAIRWAPFIVVCGVLIDACGRQVPIPTIVTAATAGAVVAAAGAMYSIVVMGDRRAAGPLEDPNDLAYVLAAAIPLLVLLLSRSDDGARKLRNMVIGAAGALLVLGVASTFSRGGILALGVAVSWLLIRRAMSVSSLIKVAGVLAIGAVTYLVIAWSTLTAGLEEKQFVAGDNIDSRLLRWGAAARMLAQEPLFGAGPGGVRSEYVSASGLAEIAEMTPVTHNMYLEVGADLGALGLALFLALIVLAFVSAERARRCGADSVAVTAAQASLLAVVVASYFLSQEYYMSLWFAIALCCALQLRSGSGRNIGAGTANS